ncbi:class I SAM-dependent methyltransferase [Aquiflexum sp. LQ15W]|uniref:class I SAM-dependent methyltransferase n=1 Tax=Cognataquiflexum nitidum TaxID=2922272 RepID=UPI001F13553B|nr:class I SAM-dependent methyltransferase [Cognataquiflexum nitidum]MCH6200179.1 class I SAM-dependent methyltransferase [Cognataquiflexum nitidum]
MSSEKMTDSLVCRICNNTEGNKTYQVKEMMFGMREKFQYFQCNKCHCLQICDFPQDMSKFYPENYYSFGKYDGKKFKGISGKINRQKYTQLVSGKSPFLRKMAGTISGTDLFFILKGLPMSKDTKILDVGCGNGKNFLYPLAEIGFENVHGCDPFLAESIDYENGLQISKSNVFDVKGLWDIITYHHSFEHIPDPLDHLQKVFELLAPGGICIIRIPTVSSFAWEHYKTNWVQLDAPRHFFLHSKESMEILGEKSHLELFKTIYDSTHFQFTGSERYIQDIPLITPNPKGPVAVFQRKMKKREYSHTAAKLNKEGRGDQAAFFFRKPFEIKK